MIRLGIIGRNFVVDWMLAAAKKVPELQPVAIFSRTREGAESFGAKYQLPFVFTDLEEMASSDEIDAVYIASPISCHYSQAELMLSHGKHVLCEKPVTSNSGELKRLIQTAKENHAIFLEAMRLVYDDALPIIQQNLPRIGRLHRATFEFTRYAPRYDLIKAGQYNSAFDTRLSNAGIMDLGCYCLHALVWLFGTPEVLAAHSTTLDCGFDASGIILLAYSTFTAEVVYSKVSKQISPSIIMGEEGSILVDDINHIRRIWFEPRCGEPEDLLYQEKLPNNMMYELHAFCGYIARGEQPIKRNQDSLSVMRLLDQAREKANIIFPADAL